MQSLAGRKVWCGGGLGARCALLLLLAALTGTGCAQQYVITTTNAGTIYCKGRPKLQHGYYIYTDAAGREERINEMRVRSIEAQ